MGLPTSVVKLSLQSTMPPLVKTAILSSISAHRLVILDLISLLSSQLLSLLSSGSRTLVCGRPRKAVERPRQVGSVLLPQLGLVSDWCWAGVVVMVGERRDTRHGGCGREKEREGEPPHRTSAYVATPNRADLAKTPNDRGQPWSTIRILIVHETCA
jgi:hypothetical protein